MKQISKISIACSNVWHVSFIIWSITCSSLESTTTTSIDFLACWLSRGTSLLVGFFPFFPCLTRFLDRPFVVRFWRLLVSYSYFLFMFLYFQPQYPRDISFFITWGGCFAKWVFTWPCTSSVNSSLLMLEWALVGGAFVLIPFFFDKDFFRGRDFCLSLWGQRRRRWRWICTHVMGLIL